MHTHADATRHHDHTVRGGPPVLDIGGDIGAMVVRMDPATAGTELHLRSEHEPPVAVHTGVWTRPHGTAMVTAAVFAELLAGRYWVLDPDGHGGRQVVIAGGELTDIDLRVSDTCRRVPTNPTSRRDGDGTVGDA